MEERATNSTQKLNQSNLINHAMKALRICQARCEAGIFELKNGDFDSYLKIQKTQQIAFANFKSLDHLALANGYDISPLTEAKSLSKSIEELNQEGVALLKKSKAEHQDRLGKISRGSRGLRNYGGKIYSVKFIKKA